MSRLCSKLAFLAFAAVVVLAAHVAQAGTFTSSEAVSAARECGVSDSMIQRLSASVDNGSMTAADGKLLLDSLVRVCQEQLPIAPFETKVAEGLAKRIPPVRILPALDVMQNQYGSARNILSSAGLVDISTVSLMGDGLAKGVSAETFKSYTDSYADQPHALFSNGLAMTSFLSQAGFDYGLTQSVLDSGFEAGTLTDQWRYLVRVVLIARKRGISDAEVAEAAQTSLSGGGSLTDVAARLGFTLRDMSGRSISN